MWSNPIKPAEERNRFHSKMSAHWKLCNPEAWDNAMFHRQADVEADETINDDDEAFDSFYML
jgi:hypothetical protein